MRIAYYVNDFGVFSIDESEPTSILVKAFPSMPDSISCVVTVSIRKKTEDNNSANFPSNRHNNAFSTNRNIRSSLLTDTLNLTSIQTTEKSVPTFREGYTIQFTCTGNIGKPPGRFVWQIIQQQREPIFYSNETTVVVGAIADLCSYRGTSNLTIEITADHFKAKVRCFEESQADVKGMFVETEPLDVYFDELRSSTESDSLNISAAYAALVIPVICVVVMSMILFGVRKHNCKSEKGKISRLNETSVIYSEVNEHTKLKYRLKNNQASSSNLEHADVEHDLVVDAEDPRFKYNMITGKLEVYSNV